MNVKECASCFKKCAQDDAHCDSDLHVGVVGRVARELPLPEKQQSRRQGTASVSGLKSAEEQTWAVVVETTNPEKYFAKQGHLTKKKKAHFRFPFSFVWVSTEVGAGSEIYFFGKGNLWYGFLSTGHSNETRTLGGLTWRGGSGSGSSWSLD